MGAQENLQSAKSGYEAFGRGDAGGAMENISDDIEWVVGGDSAVSGTKRGKQEVGEFWGRLAEKGFSTSPQHWFADGDRVAVFTRVKAGDFEADAADLLTYDSSGKLVRFQAAGNEQMLKDVFG